MTKSIKSNAAKAKQFFADKMAFTTGPVEISHQIEKGEDVAIIDVREAKDFKKGHVARGDQSSPGKMEHPGRSAPGYYEHHILLCPKLSFRRQRRDAVRGEGLFRHGNGRRL